MKELVNSSGITIRQLKQLVENLPEFDENGNDYEVWLENTDDCQLSNSAKRITQLNKGDIIISARNVNPFPKFENAPPIPAAPKTESNSENSGYLSDQMKINLIDKISQMIERENEHFKWLIQNNAPMKIIDRSSNMISHLREMHKEYVDYL